MIARRPDNERANSAPTCPRYYLVRLRLDGLAWSCSEQRIEALVVLFEDLAVAFDPIHGLPQGLRFQFAWTPLRIDAPGNETGALEHLEMSGNGRLTHSERVGELRHGGFARRQPRQDGAAGGVSQSGKGQVETFRSLHNHWVV